MMFVVRKGGIRVNKTFRTPNLLERMTAAAKKHNVSVNELLIQAAEYALDNMRDPDET